MAKWRSVVISEVSRMTPGRYEGITFMQWMDERKYKRLKRRAKVEARRAILKAQG